MVVKELWDHIFLDFTSHINFEEDNKDRGPNDPGHPKINATRMDQLSFLRPYLFNPPHQISTISQVARMTQEKSAVAGRGAKLILPPLLGFEEEETEMDFDEGGPHAQELDLSQSSSSTEEEEGTFYQDRLQHLFDQIGEAKRSECFFAVTQSLDQLAVEIVNNS